MSALRQRQMRAPRRPRIPVVSGFTRRSGFFGINRSGELKFFDIDVDDGVVSVTGDIIDSVNELAQGTQEQQRIGRNCVITNIGWRFRVSLPSSTAKNLTSDVVRVIMYLDKQCNGATATVTGILESANYQSFNNLSNKSRFRTLSDMTYDLVARSGAGNGTANDFGEDVISGSFFKKVNIPLEFDGTTGAITEIRSNNIGILFISQGGVASFDSKLRLRFSDS